MHLLGLLHHSFLLLDTCHHTGFVGGRGWTALLHGHLQSMLKSVIVRHEVRARLSILIILCVRYTEAEAVSAGWSGGLGLIW